MTSIRERKVQLYRRIYGEMIKSVIGFEELVEAMRNDKEKRLVRALGTMVRRSILLSCLC